jgi:hypothetical protein
MSKSRTRWSYAGDENTRVISASHRIPGVVVAPPLVRSIDPGLAQNRIRETTPEPMRNHA